MRRLRARAGGWRTAPGSGSSSARASALALAALAVAGCGHQQQPSQNAHDLLVQAQQGLSRIHSGTVTVHARAKTPVPLDRTQRVPARDLPFSRVRLARWTRNPHRVACGAGLECVSAEVAVREALRDLSPLLPLLPVEASSVHDAEVQVALRDHEPVYLELSGQVDAGFLLGDVPFEVNIDLPAR